MPDNIWIVILLVLGLVVLINLALWFMWRNHGPLNQINILKRTGKAFRNPWYKEDESLKELSRRVRELGDNGDPKGKE